MSHQKQRIGIVLTKPPAYSETFFRNKVDVLEKAGYEVILFTGGKRKGGGHFKHISVGFDIQRPRWQLPFQMIWATARLALSPRRAIRLFKLNQADGYSLRDNIASLMNAAHIIGYDLRWLHFGFALNAILLENLARVTGARMAVSIRGFDISIIPIKSPGAYKRVWPKVDRLHYISEALYRKALADGLPTTTSAMKIEPAVEATMVDRYAAPPPSNDGITRFLTIGRLTWKKGYPHVLRALQLLKTDGVRFTYHIIGEGEELEELLYLRKTFGLEEEVILTGKQSHQQTMSLLRGCDIYLQYSVQEGFCNAVLEAQLMGKICIVSDAEGLPENVLHGVTGWVVKSFRPDLLHQRIRETMNADPAELDQMRTTASERVKSQFSLEVQRENFIRFYGA
jgi:colanic acid/amylovoran biosynthesis glycosyltransferase